jgi:hypothetical protein
MIVGNFYFIKSTNGLYYYGLDYLRDNINLVRLVLVRPELYHQAKKALPGVKVVSCSVFGFFLHIFFASLSKDLLYTPTSHPIPWLNRQWIVLHDTYPFEAGANSSLKRLLLKFSLSLSNCKVGYINCSDAKPFVTSLGVSDVRMVFAPNRFPDAPPRIALVNSQNGTTTVGLLGTDSAKKNYDRLFRAVQLEGLSTFLSFRIYGHDTLYLKNILAQFPDFKIQLVKSDDVSLTEFMNRIDVLASAAEQEGFGRPIALAALSGLPVELLDRPVFREFFTGGAQFHVDIIALVRALVRHRSQYKDIPYVAPSAVVAAYEVANDEIHRLGSSLSIFDPES